jgi:hypothetical protein
MQTPKIKFLRYCRSNIKENVLSYFVHSHGVIYIIITITAIRPPLWSSSQSSWLQIQRSGFDSRRYQIFWEAVSLEQGPFCLMSTIEEILERKSSGSGLENRVNSCRGSPRWQRYTLYPQKFVLTSPTSGGRSIGIVRSRLRPGGLFICLVFITSITVIVVIFAHVIAVVYAWSSCGVIHKFKHSYDTFHAKT